MPFFSIIIPAKNAAEWLSEALDSVQLQTFQEFEVLLVNDGSTDATPTIMQQWQNHWSKVQVLEGGGKGLGHARNLAAQAAKGQFLAFLDADDTWMPEKLTVVFDQWQRDKAQWIYHCIKAGPTPKQAKLRKGYPLHRATQIAAKGLPITPSAAVIERKLYWTYGGFDQPTDQVEDLGLWLRLLKGGHRPEFIPQALTFYRTGTGITHQLQNHLEKVKTAIFRCENEGIIDNSLAKALLQRKHYEVARYLYKQGDFAAARQHYSLGKVTLKGIFFKLLTFSRGRL